MSTPFTGSKNVCFKQKSFLDIVFGALKTNDIKVVFDPRLKQDMLAVLFVLFRNEFSVILKRELVSGSIFLERNPLT